MPVHKIPTHLQVEEKILHLPLVGGITARQLLLLLIGGGACYHTYVSLAPLEGWPPPYGNALHWLATGVLAALALALAFGQIAGTDLVQWLLLLLLYWRRPRLCLWRSVRREGQDADREPPPEYQETDAGGEETR